MVHAAVEEAAVVRDQDKPFFLFQVGGQLVPRFGVKVVRRLVDEQKMPLPQKQRGQQHLGLLAMGKRAERPPQRPLVDAQQREFAQKLPGLGLGAQFRQQLLRAAGGVPHRVREIVERYRRCDRAAVGVTAQQQLQKRRLAAAVAADEAQLPVGVDLEADMLKNGIVAGRVAET